MLVYIYRKWGKIHLAKLSWIPPNKVFYEKYLMFKALKTMPIYEACIIFTEKCLWYS